MPQTLFPSFYTSPHSGIKLGCNTELFPRKLFPTAHRPYKVRFCSLCPHSLATNGSRGRGRPHGWGLESTSPSTLELWLAREVSMVHSSLVTRLSEDLWITRQNWNLTYFSSILIITKLNLFYTPKRSWAFMGMCLKFGITSLCNY